MFESRLRHRLDRESINRIALRSHDHAVKKGFWERRLARLDRMGAISECLLLVHTEISEAVEAMRENPDENNLGEELADAVIRIGDLAVYAGVNLSDEIAKKQHKNSLRPQLHGKSF